VSLLVEKWTVTSSRNASHTSSSERADAVGGVAEFCRQDAFEVVAVGLEFHVPTSVLDRAEGVPEMRLGLAQVWKFGKFGLTP